jgi:hypothetical protein
VKSEALDFGAQPDLPWYWEGNVQARVARFLIWKDRVKCEQFLT